MRRGEIYWAQLCPRSGAGQTGRRPVHDGFNEVPTWRSVIVVPVSTSEAQARRGPTKLRDRLGVLAAEVMGEVEDGLRVALDLQ